MLCGAVCTSIVLMWCVTVSLLPPVVWKLSASGSIQQKTSLIGELTPCGQGVAVAGTNTWNIGDGAKHVRVFPCCCIFHEQLVGFY